METTTKTLSAPSMTIAHISDLHLGSNYFVPNLLQRTIVEINELEPQAVIVTGDLTDEGFRQQYQSVKSYLDTIKCENIVVVPGNHDARNVGYVHFEEMIGPRFVRKHFPGVTLVAADSSEPDLNDGRIGRETYAWLEESFADNDDFKIFAMHHHLLPIPGTGRERNIVYDAGDVLEVLIRLGVDLVLTGHKHVPHSWKLEELYVVNAGTCATLRLRGKTKPCYNVVQFTGRKVQVFRKYPFEGSEIIVDFNIEEHRYCPWVVPAPHEAPAEEEFGIESAEPAERRAAPADGGEAVSADGGEAVSADGGEEVGGDAGSLGFSAGKHLARGGHRP